MRIRAATTTPAGLIAGIAAGRHWEWPRLEASAETVFITGANSGIGLEFARQYAAKGWTVIVTHRRKDDPKTLTDLVAKYPGKVQIEKLDVTSETEASRPRRPHAGHADRRADQQRRRLQRSQQVLGRQTNPAPATGRRRPSAR